MLQLSKAIAAAHLFTGKEQVRPCMHYVALSPHSDFLLVTATDGSAVFYGKVGLPENFGEKTMLLKSDYSKLIKENSICYIESNSVFSDGTNFNLEEQGKNANFPDVKQVVPITASNETHDNLNHFFIAPTIAGKIAKAQRILLKSGKSLPDFIPNGKSAWLCDIGDDAFCIAMPYRSGGMRQLDNPLYRAIKG